jgi:hypothetical protein
METPSKISEGLSCETGDVSEASQGGRLWEMATQEANKSQDRPMSPEASRFAESLMARTRSRADPDAVVSNSTSLERGKHVVGRKVKPVSMTFSLTLKFSCSRIR